MNYDSISNKKKRLKIYYGLLVTVLCIAGVSFAWFRLNLSQSNSNVIGTRTCLDTTLTEVTSKIFLTDVFPISDEEGLKQSPFTFTIKNNCDEYVKVSITLVSEYRESTDTKYLKDDYVKTNLSTKGLTDKNSVILNTLSLEDVDASNKGYVLEQTGLKANEEKNYDLRLWMDQETTNEQGLNKAWSGKIVVIVAAANRVMTLSEAILATNEVKTPVTVPAAAISAENEAILASVEDDYGISYYFRGAVINNYVEFANKCWRVVRIGGDNTVKLILHNDNTSNASNPCSSVNNSDTAAFARYSGSTYTSAFNKSSDDNTYVGFMYGTVGANTYDETHANINKSTALINLETWYDNNLKSYENIIDDNVFCSDKSQVVDTSFDPWNITPNGLGYGKNKTYYGAMQRLTSNSRTAGGTGPSLKCSGNFNKVTSKIGLITVDELVYAGYAFSVSDSTNYLQENAKTIWITLSPSDFFRLLCRNLEC